MRKLSSIFLAFLLLTAFMSCNATTESENPEIAANIESEEESGGATETWGMIMFDRTYPPYFELFSNSSESKEYRIELYSAKGSGHFVEIGEIQLFKKTIAQDSQFQLNSTERSILNNAQATYTKVNYISGFDELSDGNLNTYAASTMGQYQPAIFDIEFTNPQNIELIKMSFHLTDIMQELVHKMIVYKKVLGMGWIKIYQVTNMEDERFTDLQLDQLTSFKLSANQNCEAQSSLDNLGNCTPNRVICSDLTTAFNNSDLYIPCEVIHNNKVIDCVAANKENNCIDAYPVDLCQDYKHFLTPANRNFQIRSKFTNILKSQDCQEID